MMLRHCENSVEGQNFFALAAVQIGIPKRIVYLKNTTLEVSPEGG